MLRKAGGVAKASAKLKAYTSSVEESQCYESDETQSSVVEKRTPTIEPLSAFCVIRKERQVLTVGSGGHRHSFGSDASWENWERESGEYS